VGLYSADAVHPEDSVRNMITDGLMGGLKGGLIKGSFDAIGGMEGGVFKKGLFMTGASSLIDTGLTRQTYLDKNGNLDVFGGLNRVADNTFNLSTLAVGTASFGLAYGGLKLLGPAAEANPLVGNTAMGGMLGLTQGSIGEAMRQHGAGEKFDLSKIITSGLL